MTVLGPERAEPVRDPATAHELLASGSHPANGAMGFLN